MAGAKSLQGEVVWHSPIQHPDNVKEGVWELGLTRNGSWLARLPCAALIHV